MYYHNDLRPCIMNLTGHMVCELCGLCCILFPVLHVVQEWLLAERCRCPTPHVNNRGNLHPGIAPVRSLLDEGVVVGLGVDGSASNDAGHALAEARLMCLLQRAGGCVEGVEPGLCCKARVASWLWSRHPTRA